MGGIVVKYKQKNTYSEFYDICLPDVEKSSGCDINDINYESDGEKKDLYIFHKQKTVRDRLYKRKFN